LIALLLVACGPLQATAATIEGVQFEERVQAGGVEFKLNAVGLLRYMAVVKAYVAGLYLGPGCDPAAILDDSPKRLEISYFHAISASDFANATRAGIARNVTPSELSALRERIDRLVALYEDVVPGDRYSLTYVPGVGTELARNGRTLGSIEGADFASAVFAIWFGEEGVDPSLKQRLLAVR